jgi:hypothetical protein
MKPSNSPFILLFLCLVFPWGILRAETVTDVLEIKVNIAPFFKLTVETVVSPLEKTFDDSELLKPSKNDIIEGRDLDGEINLGYLIARKHKGGILPLISEYRVLLRAACESNLANAYQLSQNLVAPIAGETTGERFPEKAFVCAAEIAPEGDDQLGKVLVPRETPVIPEKEMVVYQTGPSKETYLGNVIHIYYWISDRQEDVVPVTQRADTYRSSLVITMMEL